MSTSQSEVLYPTGRQTNERASPIAKRSKAEVSASGFGSTSPRGLHKAKTTKEKQTKERRSTEISYDLSSLESEVLVIDAEQIAELGTHAKKMTAKPEAGTPMEVDLSTPGKSRVTSTDWRLVEPNMKGMGNGQRVQNGIEAFIRRFQSLYAAARSGDSCPAVNAEDRALLEHYLELYGMTLLERWLPAFFASNFGYVRRRSWSLEAYLNTIFVLQAQSTVAKNITKT